VCEKEKNPNGSFFVVFFFTRLHHPLQRISCTLFKRVIVQLCYNNYVEGLTVKPPVMSLGNFLLIFYPTRIHIMTYIYEPYVNKLLGPPTRAHAKQIGYLKCVYTVLKKLEYMQWMYIRAVRVTVWFHSLSHQ